MQMRCGRGFPRIARRVSGFNLDELLPENGFHVARSLVGSEGTCAVVLGATLRLVRSPQRRVLVGVGFADIFAAADAVPLILEHPVIGLEGFDHELTNGLRKKGRSLDQLALMPDGQGFLLAEFGADDQDEVEGLALRFAEAARGFGAGVAARIYTAAEAKHVWSIRESALGATAFVPGRGTGWEGWDDSAVEPARLGSYLRQIVVAIIALLAAIAVPGFLRARKRSQATAILNDARIIDGAIDQYAIENNKKGTDTVNAGNIKGFFKPGSRLYAQAGVANATLT